MNRVVAGKVRAILDKAFAQLQDEHGLTFEIGTGRFDDLKVNFKVTVVETNANGHVESVMVKDFRRNAHLYGLSPNDLGQEFSNGLKIYKIVGLKSNYRKYPIICELVSGGNKIGSQFKLPSDTVAFALGK